MDNQGQQELIVLDTFEPAVAFDPAKRDESRRRFSMFLVQSEAGQGGTGVVQRATNTAGEIFAIKRLHVNDTTDERIAAGMRAVLFEEYRNQLTVSHLKGFPRVYGYGTSNGEPLIVMEWVEGSTLKHITPQLPHEDGGVRGDAVAAIGVAVLSILNNVRHLDTGVAHRDISPRNIMVATSERSLQDQLATLDFDIRLIDFGSSTALNPIDPTFTVRADVWRGGTPEYAPPEMLTHDIAGIETRRLSPTVDIYALSSVLYELYCGHTPFNLQALGTASPYRVKTETAFEIPQARTAADEALVSIIVAGLAVDQERRPSVEQMLDLLRRWQSSELGDWPTPEPVWGSRVMDAQTTYIGPGTSVDEPVPATFDTAQPVMFPLADDVAAPVDPFAAAPDVAAEDTPLDHGHRDHASYMPVPVVLEAPRAAYGTDAAVSTAASMPAAPATSATPSMHAPATPAASTAAPVAQNAIFGGAAAGPSASAGSAGSVAPAGLSSTASAATTTAAAATSVSRRAFLAAGGLAFTALVGGGAYLLSRNLHNGSDTAVAADAKSDDSSSKSKKDSDSDASDSSDTSATSSNTISVEMRYAAQSDGKWGLIDDTGAWKVKPTYSDMRLYGAGLAAALDSATGMWGYIDQDGNWAIEPQFSDTRPLTTTVLSPKMRRQVFGACSTARESGSSMPSTMPWAIWCWATLSPTAPATKRTAGATSTSRPASATTCRRPLGAWAAGIRQTAWGQRRRTAPPGATSTATASGRSSRSLNPHAALPATAPPYSSMTAHGAIFCPTARAHFLPPLPRRASSPTAGRPSRTRRPVFGAARR